MPLTWNDAGHDLNRITRYRALLIGVRDYDDARFNSIKYAVADVEAVAALLGTGGYEHVDLLHSTADAQRRPTIQNIDAALTRLLHSVDDETLLLLYFAGHGLTHAGQAYLLPQNQSDTDYERFALGVAELQDRLATSPARAAVLILDACHSGALLETRAAVADFVLKTIEQAQGLTILSAADQHSLAYEDGALQHGVFTYYLLEALRGEIQQRKHPAYLTVRDAYDHVSVGLEAWSGQNPNRPQRPTWEGGAYGDPPLLKLTADASAPTQSAVNPFVAGPAIRRPERFYGREAELQAIVGRVGGVSAQSISVVGPRRIGKSSLLWQVVQQAGALCQTGHRYVGLHLDLSSAAGNSNRALMRTLRRELTRAGLPAWPPDEDGDLTSLTYALEDLERDHPEVRLVLCLDEFEHVNARPAEFDGLLGALRYEGSLGRLALVTASRTPLADLCAQGRIKVSPFFNIFTQTRLGDLDEAAWRDLLHDGLGDLSRADESFIARCAGRHPFFTQLAAGLLWEARRHNSVDYAALQAAFEQQAAPFRAYAAGHAGPAAAG